MANSAVTIGVSMPNSEPNARKSTTAAAPMPTNSLSPAKRLLDRLDDVAAQLHLEAVGPRAVRGVDEVVHLRLVQLGAQHVIRHRGVRRPAVLADLRGTRGVVGADDLAYVLLVLDLVQHRLDALPHRRVPHRTLVDVPHHGVGLAGLVVHRLVQQVDDLARLGVGEREDIRVGVAGDLARGARAEQRRHPQQNHQPFVPEAPSRQSGHDLSPIPVVSHVFLSTDPLAPSRLSGPPRPDQAETTSLKELQSSRHPGVSAVADT